MTAKRSGILPGNPENEAFRELLNGDVFHLIPSAALEIGAAHHLRPGAGHDRGSDTEAILGARTGQPSSQALGSVPLERDKERQAAVGYGH